jgi:hypothetical protein
MCAAGIVLGGAKQVEVADRQRHHTTTVVGVERQSNVALTQFEHDPPNSRQ